MTTVEIDKVSAPPTVREDAREERERRARVLEAAALEIEVRGWCQAMTCAANGSVCAGGAIFAALGYAPPPDTHLLDVEPLNRMAEVAGTPFFGIARFNDEDGRTAAEVTFLLRWRAEEIRDGL